MPVVTGQAWSHPHDLEVIDRPFMSDGYYGAESYAILFDGASTMVNCGSGATLDDIPSGGQITIAAWMRCDGTTRIIVSKGYPGSGGYSLFVDASGQLSLRVDLATTDVALSFTGVTINDGKLHYVGFHYSDATKTGRLFVDGTWSSTHTGAGAYQSDAANDLVIGRRSTIAAWFMSGVIGGVMVWSDDHHVAGTNFVPPRTNPAAGGNLVESWHLDEGTGTTATAQVTSPGNDGTITAGTWQAQWEPEGTPVIPQSLATDGTATYVQCGSAAALDDVPSGIMTVEAWARTSITGGTIASKGDVASNGWRLYTAGNVMYLRVMLATTNAVASTPFASDRILHHVVGYYNNATKVARVAVDGIWGNATTGTGAYQSDAAANLNLGRLSGGGSYWTGALGRVRISNNDRYGGATGKPFVPPSRVVHPAPDGNTVVQYNFTDGAGTTLTDAVGANNGTITMGAGGWRNTPDMAVDEPNARIFDQGYNVGSDAADDGITIIEEAVTAETDYVVRAVVSIDQSGRAQPQVYLWDNIGGAQIGADFNGPKHHGQHSGANNSATLVCATGQFRACQVGATVYNITDGSSSTITAVSGDGTTITGVLAGGTDNDWDTNDVFLIRYGVNYCRRPFVETFTFRTPAGCTSIDVKVLNPLGEGVLSVHQVEVLESLFDNGDMEAGAGNPWLPTGWANFDLDAGDTEAEAAIIHAGSQSMEWNPGAVNEGISRVIAAAAGRYFSMGAWVMGDGAIGLYFSPSGAHALLQYSDTLRTLTINSDDVWNHGGGVWRSLTATPTIFVMAPSGATGDRFLDDVYGLLLTDVSLTVAPASEANSVESGGLRVDGRDILTQPVTVLRSNRGRARWDYIPRHDAADSVAFGNATPVIAHFHGNATNYIYVEWSAANTIRLRYRAGGAEQSNTWNAVGAITTGTTYTFEIRYRSTGMKLYVDGTERIDIAQPVAFGTIPTVVYWGSVQAGGSQVDTVFA